MRDVGWYRVARCGAVRTSAPFDSSSSYAIMNVSGAKPPASARRAVLSQPVLMNENTMNPWTELEFLRVRQVACLLNISRLGVYRLIERGLVPVYRVARCALLKRSDLVAFLTNCRVPARHDATYVSQKD